MVEKGTINPSPRRTDPLESHAQSWGRVQAMDPDARTAQSTQLDYILPLLGKLAGNPKVMSKDVIKAAADTVAAGKADPSGAVKFISGMPADPHKLQSWLKALYESAFSTQVHMKAAAMGQQQQQQQIRQQQQQQQQQLQQLQRLRQQPQQMQPQQQIQQPQQQQIQQPQQQQIQQRQGGANVG